MALINASSVDAKAASVDLKKLSGSL